MISIIGKLHRKIAQFWHEEQAKGKNSFKNTFMITFPFACSSHLVRGLLGANLRGSKIRGRRRVQNLSIFFKKKSKVRKKMTKKVKGDLLQLRDANNKRSGSCVALT